jgi:thiamine-phosphate pyrophosphorylase
MIGQSKIIGISVESLRDAVEAQEGGADYLGVSPIFATPTKSDAAPPLGLEGLLAIRRRVRIPLVAIGGVNCCNAADIIRCGAEGVAVVSAIVSADDPTQAARELVRKIAESKRK